MPYINKEGLKRLDTYKYKSGGYSKLDNKMNPFWEWVETLLPKVITRINHFLKMLFEELGTKFHYPSWFWHYDCLLFGYALVR